MSSRTPYKNIKYTVVSVKMRSGWSRFWYLRYCDCEATVEVDGEVFSLVFCSTLNGNSPQHNLGFFIETEIVDRMKNTQEDIDAAIPVED